MNAARGLLRGRVAEGATSVAFLQCAILEIKLVHMRLAQADLVLRMAYASGQPPVVARSWRPRGAAPTPPGVPLFSELI